MSSTIDIEKLYQEKVRLYAEQGHAAKEILELIEVNHHELHNLYFQNVDISAALHEKIKYYLESGKTEQGAIDSIAEFHPMLYEQYLRELENYAAS